MSIRIGIWSEIQSDDWMQLVSLEWKYFRNQSGVQSQRLGHRDQQIVSQQTKMISIDGFRKVKREGPTDKTGYEHIDSLEH